MTLFKKDDKSRFTSATNNTTNTTTKYKENETMRTNNTNNKDARMAALQTAGVNTSNFFNINMNVPVGAKVEILVNGVPYTVETKDAIVDSIMDNGYVFNRRTDGRFIVAQTFKMLNGRSYNFQTRTWENGWDAYVRNNYGYMYQFDMMLDELHRLAKMEKDNDPDFDRLSRFFTKDVVFNTCRHYTRQLRKYVAKQPTKKCNGKPYVRLPKYYNVFVSDLDNKVYTPLNIALVHIDRATNYRELEKSLKAFMSFMCKLPYETPKCSAWKDAFKGKGAYVTLLNLCKFHNFTVSNYETGVVYNRDNSILYIDSMLNAYAGQYWKFHEMLKAEIARNNFDLKESITSQNE